MSCPSESTVAGFLERRLSSDQRAVLEAHVEGCVSCRRLVIELSSGLQLVSVVAEAHTTHPMRVPGHGEVLAKGIVVSRFVVLDLLGRGGMGAVYMAYDPELDRKVALKLLHPGTRSGDDPRAQLVAEAQLMARVSHANVIAIYDIGNYRDQVFAAMELVEGTTLRRWMAERRSRTWREVVDVLLLAGEGLAAAHAANVVHRDFKPENVLIGRDGRVKVSDFGLAAPPSPARGPVAGTPGYLPVEALQTGVIDERGDQFSFCITFYEALYGYRPFSADTFDALVAEVRRGPAPQGRRRVPARLSRVVCRGLALAPDRRYPSMRELLADTRHAVAVHRRLRIVAAAIGALALALGAFAFAVNTRAAVPQRACAQAEAKLANVWDSARRDAVRAAFLRTGLPAAPAELERAVAALDRYTAAWVNTRTDACEATEVRHEQSAALLELRMACLDRAFIQLRALSDALVAADADTVRKAESAAAGLPGLAACSDVDALRAIVSPPLSMTPRTPIVAAAAASDEARGLMDGASVQPGGLATLPDFRLPFACGEAWQITSKERGSNNDAADFILPGDVPSARFAVFVSAPGWVSRVVPDNGEVDIAHGGGWFTTYQHMTEISVAVDQYVGRGQVIGKVGNINVKNSLGEPGPAHLHYEQTYQPGVARASFEHVSGSSSTALYLERETFQPRLGPQLRTSTNNCLGGGVPGSSAQYDVPIATNVFSASRYTMEILTRRASDNALFERWYHRGWRGAALPATAVGRPAVVVFNGELHVIARNSEGKLFDLRYNPFTGWHTTYLEGRVSGDPDVAIFGWRNSLHVAARNQDGYLFVWCTAPNGAWSHPMQKGTDRLVGTPALFSYYDALYVVARSEDNSLWSWHVDRLDWWTRWQLRGAASDDPNIGIDPRSGRVNVVARGLDNRLYRWVSNHPDTAASLASDGWGDPELIDDSHRVRGTAATIIYHGAMHLFARGLDNAVYHWWKDETWHWETTGGAYTDSPDVFHFGGQLHTFGRGMDGTLYTVWFDPAAGFWNVENGEVPIAE
jgi:predicted Ser/Thr protein kinase